MKVYEALAQAFAAENANAIFGMMGDGNMYWMTALEKHPAIQVYEARFEGAGLAMADGWARVTGEPGVCTVTCGPGITQLATSLVVASRAQTPIVVFAGAAPTTDFEYVQRFDQERFAAATEAGFVPILSPDGAYEAVRTAFYRARVESRPIILNAPMDVQQMELDDEEPYQPSRAILPTGRAQPDAESLARAADLIAGSSRVVLVAGRGAMLAGAREAILQLGDRTGALLATTLIAKNWFASEPWQTGISGLFATRAAMELLTEADCVIGIGASLNHYTTEHGYLFPNASYVHIDVQPHLRMSGGRVAECYLQGDAKATTEALVRLLAEKGGGATGYRTSDTKAKLAANFDPREFPTEDGLADPRLAAIALDEALPEDVSLIIGGGHFISFPTMHMNRPRQVVSTVAFGCIGQGLGTAIGAAVAFGNKPAVLVEGDASALMHIQELDTARRYRTPLLMVVFNDEALGAEYHKLMAHDLNQDLARISTPDLGSVGQAFGGRGCIARSVDDLKRAVQDFVAKPGLMVVDLRVSRRVVSVPYRRMHFGQDA